MICDVGITGGF